MLCMQKKVLVTGGAGFLGVNLAKKLLSLGFEVSLFDFLPLRDVLLQKKVHFILGDIQNKQDVYNAVRGHEYIVHTAALLFNNLPRERIFGVNVKGTNNILDASLRQKIRRFVYISSTEVYGQSKHPDTETRDLHPSGNYAESKVHAEALCKEYALKGLSIVILRPRTLLGFGKLGIFEKIFHSISVGKPVFLLGTGNNLFQFLFISDLIDVIVKALMLKTSKYEVFNVGSKLFSTWRFNIEAVISKARSHSKIISLPILPILSITKHVPFLKVVSTHYENIAYDSFVSTYKTEKLLRWQPKISDKDLLLDCYDEYVRKSNNNKIG